MMMKGGSLVVILVGAHGIKQTNLFGTSVYHAILECGDQVYYSKYSSGRYGEVFWNQKFIFEFSDVGWRHLMHLKIKIMNYRILRASEFLGQSIIHIGRMVEESTSRGVLEVRPNTYNVVLDDDTYKGEIKLAMKFIANTEGDRDVTKLSSTFEPYEENESLLLTIRKLVSRYIPNRTIFKSLAS